MFAGHSSRLVQKGDMPKLGVAPLQLEKQHNDMNEGISENREKTTTCNSHQQQQSPRPRDVLQSITPPSSGSGHDHSPPLPIPTVSGSLAVALAGRCPGVTPVLRTRRAPSSSPHDGMYDDSGEDGEGGDLRVQRRTIKDASSHRRHVGASDEDEDYPHDRPSPRNTHHHPHPVAASEAAIVTQKKFRVSQRIFVQDYAFTQASTTVTVGETIEFCLLDVPAHAEHMLEGRSIETSLRFESPLLTMAELTTFRFCPMVCGEIVVHCKIYTDMTCTVSVVPEVATSPGRTKGVKGIGPISPVGIHKLRDMPRRRATSPISRPPADPFLALQPALVAMGLGMLLKGARADYSSDSSFYDSDDIVSEPDSGPGTPSNPSKSSHAPIPTIKPALNPTPKPIKRISASTTTTVTTATTTPTTTTTASSSINSSSSPPRALLSRACQTGQEVHPAPALTLTSSDIVVRTEKYNFSPQRLVLHAPTRVFFTTAQEHDTNTHSLTCRSVAQSVPPSSSAAKLLRWSMETGTAGSFSSIPLGPVGIVERALLGGCLVGSHWFDTPGEYLVCDEVFSFMQCRVVVLSPRAMAGGGEAGLSSEGAAAVGSSKKNKKKKKKKRTSGGGEEKGEEPGAAEGRAENDANDSDRQDEDPEPAMSLSLLPPLPRQSPALSPLTRQQMLLRQADYSEDLGDDDEPAHEPPPYELEPPTYEASVCALPSPPAPACSSSSSSSTTAAAAVATTTTTTTTAAPVSATAPPCPPDGLTAKDRKRLRREERERREEKDRARLLEEKQRQREAELAVLAVQAAAQARGEMEQEEQELAEALRVSLETAQAEEKERMERENRRREEVARREREKEEEKERARAHKEALKEAQRVAVLQKEAERRERDVRARAEAEAREKEERDRLAAEAAEEMRLEKKGKDKKAVDKARLKEKKREAKAHLALGAACNIPTAPLEAADRAGLDVRALEAADSATVAAAALDATVAAAHPPTAPKNEARPKPHKTKPTPAPTPAPALVEETPWLFPAGLLGTEQAEEQIRALEAFFLERELRRLTSSTYTRRFTSAILPSYLKIPSPPSSSPPHTHT